MKLKDWYKSSSRIFSARDRFFLLKELFPNEQNIPFSFKELSLSKLKKIEKITRDYEKGKPLAYILNKEEFYGRAFTITQEVLIPRVETEVITEKALKYIKENHLIEILDLCCGSGIIGITLKKEMPKISVTCVDISDNSLSVARANAMKTDCFIKFHQSDLFSQLAGRKYDMIVTNPPYVESAAITGSLQYEPKIALDGGHNGFEILARVFCQASEYLSDRGCLIFEMGYNQKEMAAEKIEEYGYKVVEWIKDYSGNWRGGVLIKT